jgi:hypothetical protein
MTRERLVYSATGLVSLIVIVSATAMVAQSRQSLPADKIGSPRNSAHGITREALVVTKEWPVDVPKLGPLLILGGKATVRLPSSLQTIRVSVNPQVTMITLNITKTSNPDLVVLLVDSTKQFAPHFDILRRLNGVVPDDGLAALWPQIQKQADRTDRQNFQGAMSATIDAYRSSTDYISAAVLLNGLEFRANYGLDNGAKVTTIVGDSNTIYSHPHTGCMDRRLWVFNKQGLLLGEVHCSEQYSALALAVAESMNVKQMGEDPVESEGARGRTPGNSDKGE